MELFETHFKKHEALIFKVLRKLRIFRNNEDLYQIASMALWDAICSYKEERGNFEMYAYSLIRYAVIKEMKAISRAEELNLSMEEEKLMYLVDLDASDKRGDVFQGEWYQSLSLKEQQLIQHIFVYGWTIDEVASFQGITNEAAKKRRQRVLKKIKELIMEAM